MKFSQRVLHNDIDLSVKLNDYRTGEVAANVGATGYLYIAQEVPFNNVWVDVGTVNTTAAVATVEVWWGNSWNEAVDLTDETAASGKSLAQDGRISWSTDRLKNWDVEATSADVTGLTTTEIYNMYWTRISWDADLLAGTTLKYIGQKFSTDTDLYAYYPDLRNADLRDAFEDGKNDWDEQHYIATENIVNELIKRRIIWSRGQIADWYLFREASCHKTAELIYKGLGLAFRENMSLARADYKEAMNLDKYRIDKNSSGNLEPGEKRKSTTFVSR